MPAVEEVVAEAAPEAVRGRAAEEAVVAAAAGDVLHVLEDVVELARRDLAVVGDAVQRHLERQGARCVGRRVDGAASRQHVGAEPAVEAVGCAEAEELIRPWAADQDVASRAAARRFDVGVDVVGSRRLAAVVVSSVVDGHADARRRAGRSRRDRRPSRRRDPRRRRDRRRRSATAPWEKVSFPSSPYSSSSPGPPAIASLPAPARISFGPALPVSESLAEPPTRFSTSVLTLSPSAVAPSFAIPSIVTVSGAVREA